VTVVVAAAGAAATNDDQATEFYNSIKNYYKNAIRSKNMLLFSLQRVAAACWKHIFRPQNALEMKHRHASCEVALKRNTECSTSVELNGLRLRITRPRAFGSKSSYENMPAECKSKGLFAAQHTN